jgi:hypothetical protein
LTILVVKTEAGLFVIGVGKPAQQVVETSVFHGSDNHMLDARKCWIG